MGMQGSRSLIAGYPFEGNCNDVMQTYNGTPTNITYVNGVYGKAASFNGASSYVNCGDFENNIRAAFCWIKMSSNGNYGIITRLHGINIPRWGFRTTNGILEFISRDHVRSTGINIADGEWHRIGFCLPTFDYIHIYIDTVNVVSSSITLVSSEASLMLGCQELSIARRFLNGLMENVKIYKKALTQSEIQRDYLNLPIF